MVSTRKKRVLRDSSDEEEEPLTKKRPSISNSNSDDDNAMEEDKVEPKSVPRKAGAIPRRKAVEKEKQPSLLLTQSMTPLEPAKTKTSAKTSTMSRPSKPPPSKRSEKSSIPQIVRVTTPEPKSERKPDAAPVTALTPEMQRTQSFHARGISDGERHLLSALEVMCKVVAQQDKERFLLKGSGIDLSGSFLDDHQYDYFDLDTNGHIVLQEKIPIFPEDFPPGKEEWPLSWWGIVDPAIGERKIRASPPPRVEGEDGFLEFTGAPPRDGGGYLPDRAPGYPEPWNMDQRPAGNFPQQRGRGGGNREGRGRGFDRGGWRGGRGGGGQFRGGHADNLTADRPPWAGEQHPGERRPGDRPPWSGPEHQGDRRPPRSSPVDHHPGRLPGPGGPEFPGHGERFPAERAPREHGPDRRPPWGGPDYYDDRDRAQRGGPEHPGGPDYYGDRDRAQRGGPEHPGDRPRAGPDHPGDRSSRGRYQNHYGPAAGLPPGRPQRGRR